MRYFLLKIGALAIVAVCVGGHISELFDRWESAVISGNDVDYSCVIVAAVAGAVIVISGMMGKLFPIWPKLVPGRPTSCACVVSCNSGSIEPAHSPPFALRI